MSRGRREDTLRGRLWEAWTTKTVLVTQESVDRVGVTGGRSKDKGRSVALPWRRVTETPNFDFRGLYEKSRVSPVSNQEQDRLPSCHGDRDCGGEEYSGSGYGPTRGGQPSRGVPTDRTSSEPSPGGVCGTKPSLDGPQVWGEEVRGGPSFRRHPWGRGRNVPTLSMLECRGVKGVRICLHYRPWEGYR